MNRFACHQFEIGQRVLLKNGLLFLHPARRRVLDSRHQYCGVVQ